MIFVADYWWLWLITLVLSLGFAVYSQISRTQKLARTMVKTATSVAAMAKSHELNVDQALGAMQDVERGVTSFLLGLKMLVLAGIVSWLSGVLFIIAVVINIVKYFKG